MVGQASIAPLMTNSNASMIFCEMNSYINCHSERGERWKSDAEFHAEFSTRRKPDILPTSCRKIRAFPQNPHDR
jgi:hypothetical protein